MYSHLVRAAVKPICQTKQSLVNNNYGKVTLKAPVPVKVTKLFSNLMSYN